MDVAKEEKVYEDQIDPAASCDACPDFLSGCLGFTFPCLFCCGATVIDEKEEAVVLIWGKFRRKIKDPGCYCINPCGTSLKRFQTKSTAVDLKDIKVTDFNGSPLVVSGVCTYYISNITKSVFGVSDTHVAHVFEAVLKKVTSNYAYDSSDPDVPTLRGESDRVNAELQGLLQEKTNRAGVTIQSFEITDLSYSRGIAQAMLVRQQAEAMLEARKKIVDGAVEVVAGAIKGLQNEGVEVPPREQARITTNLLSVVCGDANVQPTLNV